MAAKMATIVGNVTGPQQRHHPYNMPPLVEKINGFPLKVKSFRNTATLQKLKEGGGGGPPPPPPPSPLPHCGGMNLHVL